MVKHTLRKLTLTNSLVFLGIFAAFTSLLYGYLSYRLFDTIDETMREYAHYFRLANGAIASVERPVFDPRIFLLLRSTEGDTIDPNPFRTEEEVRNIIQVASTVKVGELQTQEYEGHTYRMMRWLYQYPDNVYGTESGFYVQSVIVVSIVDSEVQLLDNLFWIMVCGGTLGVLCIIPAGYFLARRAMIPICEMLEKQQQFVSDASHELRTPITGIYSNAELLLKYPNHSNEENDRIHTIMKESKRMIRLITSLLTLARSDAKKTEMQYAVVNISELVRGVVEFFEILEEAQNIQILVSIQPNLRVMGDEERLHQVVVVLLDNAFKYTRTEGTVTISCTQSGRKVMIRVQDTGVGISPESVPHIFDRFYREDKARSRVTGGTGLGLSIAKLIVEEHYGEIWVESAVGKGTIFTIAIPAIK